MTSFLRQICLTILILSSFCSLQGAHLVGGELSYRCLGNNTYEIRLLIYRDCAANGAPFDDPAIISIFDGSNTLVKNLFIPLESSSLLPINAPDNCTALPVFVCTQEGLYLDTVQLPANGGPFTLSHQRCCRNSSIDNIANPRLWGTTYTIEIPANASCNSSPSFASPPPLALCLNVGVNLDMSAIESDGDSLYYFLCDPLHGGGNQVNTSGPNSPRPDTATKPPYISVPFSAGYNAQNPIPSNPVFAIDPITGLLSGTPNQIGQYVFAICVEEYRNGVLLSTLRRDFQFNVTSACVSTLASFSDQNLDPFQLCTGKTIKFNETCINTTSYFWDFGVPGINTDTSNLANPTYTFPDTGVYQVRLIANPNSTCADTTLSEFKVFNDLNASFFVGGQACFDVHSFNFIPQGNFGPNATYQWDFGGLTTNGLSSSSSASPTNIVYAQPGSYLVRLEIADGFCRDVFEDSVILYPRPLLKHELEAPPACAPYVVNFSDSSEYFGQVAHFWDFGDGFTSIDSSPQHTYSSPGSFTVYHRLTTLTACRDTLEEFSTEPIIVWPTPFSSFSISPLETTIFNPNFTIAISSENYIRSEMIFPDGRKLINHSNDLAYIASDTGIQKFTHIVYNEFDCSDTTIIRTYVQQPFRLYVPNAFTPNGNGLNDVFRYSILGVSLFNIRILNRWGQIIFTSDDASLFWNGRLQNEGDLLPGGAYTYVIEVIDKENGTAVVKRGLVSLIR